MRFFVCTQYELPGYGFLSANHGAVCNPYHQTTDLRVDDSVHYSG